MNNLIKCSTFGYKRASRKIFNEHFDNDLKDYNKKLGEMRKHHKKVYWDH